MGIQTEYNPDLALRHLSFFEKGERKEAECIPRKLEAGRTYPFLKKGQRNYWLLGEIPLLETDGRQLSRPLASVRIVQATHILIRGDVWTTGEYVVVQVFDPADKIIHFEGFSRR